MNGSITGVDRIGQPANMRQSRFRSGPIEADIRGVRSNQRKPETALKFTCVRLPRALHMSQRYTCGAITTSAKSRARASVGARQAASSHRNAAAAWCPSEVDIHRGLRDASVALIIHIRRCIDAYEYCA